MNVFCDVSNIGELVDIMITCFMICQIVERVGVLFHNSCYVRERDRDKDRQRGRQTVREKYIYKCNHIELEFPLILTP